MDKVQKGGIVRFRLTLRFSVSQRETSRWVRRSIGALQQTLTMVRIISRINAGAVGVNSSRFVGAETPWAGFKESGFGKENTVYGLEEYAQLNLVTIDFS